MKTPIMVLEQQSWRGGAQCVLEVVLDSLQEEFDSLVVFPETGPFSEDLCRKGLKTITCPLGTYRPGRKSIGEIISFGVRSPRCGLQLAYTILQRKIRLIYINGPRWLAAGTLAARLTARPSLFHLHNTLTRSTDLFLAARAVRHVSRIVACSNAAARSLLTARPDLIHKTSVLYNPLRPLVDGPSCTAPDMAAVRASAGFVVGMVGRITEAKGHHILVRAVAKLPSHLKENLQLVVVGAPAPGIREDSIYLNSLKGLASQLGLEEKIHWAGYREDPGEYYSRMQVLVLPSTCEEGFPLVVLEALQRGIPVLASRTGGSPEVVQDGVNGFLVPPGDERALTQALGRMLGNPSTYERLRAGAQATVDYRFSEESFRRSIRTIVSEVCQRVPAGNPTVRTGSVEVRV